jgi:hypothetical protein
MDSAGRRGRHGEPFSIESLPPGVTRAAALMPAMKAVRHEHVDFHFLGKDEDSNLSGTVIIRDCKMVLEIPGGDGPYLLVGEASQHWFEGQNSAHDRQYDVTASWANVGERYVGIWVEDGWEYLFSFRLGTAAASGKAKETP